LIVLHRDEWQRSIKEAKVRIGLYSHLRRRRRFFVYNRIISAVNMVEFVSNRISYITMKGRWCDIIVINVHDTTEDKDDDMKDRFYEELEQVFDQFPRYHMKILVEVFNVKVGKGTFLNQ
jgi:hypothetical protein